jgi:hypothetical protein
MTTILVEKLLDKNGSECLLRRRHIHPINTVTSTLAQPQAMVTRALLITLNWVPAAFVNNAHSTRPLARRLDTDILRRCGRGRPDRVLGCQGVPDADRIV